MRFFLILFLFLFQLFAKDEYYITKSSHFSLIYAKEYTKEATFLYQNLDKLLEFYNKSYGFEMDEPMRIVLVSNNNQIPNAFSTQVPFNLGVYYNGGSGMNTYFATKSWLETLLFHEIAHNYQINTKKSKASQTLHKYLGNNYMPIFASIVPFFTLPNLLLPTPLLEGNSVLQESIYQNGGRLHSGIHKALTNALILNDRLTIERFINDHAIFPYLTEKYIVGGFFMEYLRTQYSLDKINSFFYKHSDHEINPFLVNNSFLRTFGKSLPQLFYEFIADTKEKNKDFKQLKNNRLASSKAEIIFTKNKNKIYFITNDLVTNKELVVYDTLNKNVKKETTNLLNGKLFLINDKVYSASSGQIAYDRYKFGLFDEDLDYIEDSLGKDIQDIYDDKKQAYIDINSSFLNTKLYVNERFYTTIESNALFDEHGDIYYFKQIGDTKELYKNKKKIFSYMGHFGKIIDIKDNGVYFIANSLYGSTLYIFDMDTKQLLRALPYDNIVDGKAISATEVLVSTINENGYYLHEISLEKEKVTTIPRAKITQYNTGFHFDYENDGIELQKEKYNTFSHMKFSALYPYYSFSSVSRDLFGFNASFYDPLLKNGLNIFAQQLALERVAGFSFINSSYFPMGVSIYGVDYEKRLENEKQFGGNIFLSYPFIQTQRTNLDLNIDQYFDTNYKDKNPLVMSLNHKYKQFFPLAMNYHFLSDLHILGSKDRGDTIYGGKYKFTKHLFSELYFNTNFQYLTSNTNSLQEGRGIKIINDPIYTSTNNTNILIEGFDSNFYVKKITAYSLGLQKSFHLSHYFYKLPFGIQRESLFYKHNNYKLDLSEEVSVKENIYGLRLDLLLGHKLSLPLEIKYINNDTAQNRKKLKVSFGLGF